MPCRTAPGVPDAQLDQAAGSKLAVDGEVEQRQLAPKVGELKADPHRPDLFELKRRFLTYELSLVPGLAIGRCAVKVFHGWLPQLQGQPICSRR
jgi:hypothetical protein